MSDTPAGPGWWQASDDKWYPPEQHPDHRPATPPASQWGTYGEASPPPGQAPGPPGYAPYGQPPPYGGYGGYAPPVQTSGKATGALVASILSFVVCPVIPAIVGLVLGGQAKKEIAASEGRLTGLGLVTASRIISVINLVLSVLAIVGIALLIAFADDIDDDLQGFGDDTRATIDLSNAASAATTFFGEQGLLPTAPAQLEAVDPTLAYERGTLPTSPGVIVFLTAGNVITFGTRSGSGECFYLRDGGTGETYARDEECRSFESQTWESGW